ncbi:MAG: PDZ domain-containing protein [Thermoplasmata archaeon]|nr:PDZ domain-containing protein [Thermoplasmata archaeon]MCI4359983.1 PDZ domain-containing protein [Thermoplasmata archaeon]
MRITYSVGLDRPAAHRAEITLRLEGLDSGPIDVVFPSWVPGSYTIRPIARNVRGLRAVATPSGSALVTERMDKSRWRITVGPEPAVRIEYSVYGHELLTRTLDVTDEHLFLNAAYCLPYVDGHKDGECDLELHVRPEWRILTELREVERVPPTFRAATYDELVDSPVDCGTPVVLPIAPKGVAHRIVLCGQGGNYEAHRLEGDVTKIVEATARLFGELPNEPYTFFYHLTDRLEGGLEHRRSSSMVVPRTVFRPESDYVGFLRLTSHEYFHRFNVKRIRPKALGPFDYTRENYTHLLWAMEGTTDYYAPLLLRRAGLTSPTQYLERIAKDIHQYLETPGRLVTSLEEASFLSWIDQYHWYEETPNQSVSYYLKGALVSLCLDLEVRHRSENRSSLDEVFRTLWKEYGAREIGLDEDELLPIAERATGLALGEFFGRFVSGTEEIDFGSFARYAGLALAPLEKKPEPGEDGPAGYLGIDFEKSNGWARVRTVRDGSPGRRAGLSPGDEIVALDHVRVPFEQFGNALKRYPAGSSVDLAIFRRGYLAHRTVTTGQAPPETLVFSAIAEPSELQKQIYEAWLDSPWSPPKPKPAEPRAP